MKRTFIFLALSLSVTSSVQTTPLRHTTIMCQGPCKTAQGNAGTSLRVHICERPHQGGHYLSQLVQRDRDPLSALK
jgi:hypothetical protein